MSKYLIVDGMLHGTGIRDSYQGGYINPASLGISSDLIRRIENWLQRYEKEHYAGYINSDIINALDIEGVMIARALKDELNNYKIEYFSNAKMLKIEI